jgi:hypothetical protein
MKKLIYIFALFLLSTSQIFAQDLPGGVTPEEIESTDGTHTSFSMTNRTYSSIAANGVNMNNRWALELGFGGGYMLSQYFSIGINSGYLFTHTIKVKNEESAHINMSHFGLDGQFFFMNTRKFKLPLHAYFGTAFSQKLSGNQIAGTQGSPIVWSFLFEPGIAFDFEFMNEMWLSLGGNYRFVFGFDAFGMDSKDMSGLNISLKYKYYMF